MPATMTATTCLQQVREHKRERAIMHHPEHVDVAAGSFGPRNADTTVAGVDRPHCQAAAAHGGAQEQHGLLAGDGAAQRGNEFGRATRAARAPGAPVV